VFGGIVTRDDHAVKSSFRRAVYSDAKVILLDEPLAAMGSKESAIIIDATYRTARI
jgi:ABC-type sugar transport system ATPase subunit